MRIKFEAIFVIYIILLSAFFINWDFDSVAKDFNNEMKNTLNSRSNGHPRDRNFDWGEIEVISEPIPGQNNNINGSHGLKIAVEGDRIYVVWVDLTNFSNSGGDHDIFYRYFNGTHWSEIQVISEPIEGQNYNTGISYSVNIAVENGKIFVVWDDNNDTNGAGTDNDIFYRCNITGSNWEDIQVVSEPVPGKNLNTGKEGGGDIEIENGNTYIVWTDSTNINNAGEDTDIFFRCNFTGSNWEDIQVISEPVDGRDFNTKNSFGPHIAVENGIIHIVWIDSNNTNNASSIYQDYDIFYRYGINGSSWKDILVISEPKKGLDLNSGFSYRPAIAVENSKIYVAWEDDNNTRNSGMDLDIFFRCNLFGTSWEPIQVLSEPILNQNLNYKDSTSPDIDIENDRIYVVWEDNNNTNNADEDSDIFYICNFTGFSWEPVQVISEPVKNSNLNTQTSRSPDFHVQVGKIYIIWEDNCNLSGSGFDDDIFYRCIKDPSPLFLNLPDVTPTSGNTSTDFNFTVTYFNYDNTSPKEISVKISGTKYSMSEVDPFDTYYLDGKNYFFNINNQDVGVHTYQYHTYDGKFTWSTRLFNKLLIYNTPPEIITKNNQTAIEDVIYKVDYEFNDIDKENIGQVGIWNLSTNAIWLNLNSTIGVLNGSPINDDVGEYWVNITMNDGIDIDYSNFTLTVINVNDAPVIITNDIKIVNEDDLYEVNYNAIDVDSDQDKLNWTMSTNSTWLEFNSISVKLTGTPENNDVDEYWVNISVRDNEYIDFTNFTLIVVNTNDPPVIIVEDKINVTVGELYSVNYEAIDIDPIPNIMSWALSTNAGSWININRTTGWLNGTPLKNDVGVYWVNVSVNDGEGGNDCHNFTIIIVSSEENTSKENTSWYWIIWIVILLIIIAFPVMLIINKKRKATKIPTVKAELLQAPPKHIALPTVTPGAEKARILIPQTIVSEQLPTPIAQRQVQPAIATPIEKAPAPSLAPTTVTPQYQLPKTTLTKAQQLGLLKERFLRGEVTEETYKKLRAEIEGSSNDDITVTEDEGKEQNIISEQQKQKFTA